MTPIMMLSLASLICLAAPGRKQQGPTLQPFVMSHRDGEGSLVDLSALHPGPAGADGFIQVKNGHFATGNGKRIRFWGVHLTDWSRGSVLLPPKEDAAMWAASLSRFGVNLVRLHFLDLPSPRGIIDSTRDDSQSFDPQQLDRLDFMVCELKKRGIYVDLNLNVGRSYKAGDGVKDAARIGWAKALTYYDTRLIELQKDYARQVLTHVNPYTKTEYRHEPAVAIVEIANENALWLGYQPPTPFYANELTEQYNSWLAKNRSGAAVAKLREFAGVAPGENVPRLKSGEVQAAPAERFEAELSFFMSAEDTYYRQMGDYIKGELGVKVPVIGTADHSHSSSSYPMLASLAKLDAVDGHVYWQHPGSPVMNTPMVNDPAHSTVVQLSRSAFAGKPYTVSETNHPFPNDYASEGIPIIAAYGSFQDWDAIIFYTFEPKLAADWKSFVGDPFDLSLDPVRMTQIATGALTFLRADVRPARTTIRRSYSKQQTIDSRRLPYTEQPYFTPGFPLTSPLQHGVRISSLAGRPTAPFDSKTENPIRSDTGELAWYNARNGGLLTVNTARSQCLIGFSSVGPNELTNLSASITNRFTSLSLVSMDGLPISRSSELLLTAGARVENTAMKWNSARTRMTDIGGPPSLIETVAGALVLRNLRGAKSVRVQPLDGSGHPLGSGTDAVRSTDGWSFSIGSIVTTWYRITVQHE